MSTQTELEDEFWDSMAGLPYTERKRRYLAFCSEQDKLNVDRPRDDSQRVWVDANRWWRLYGIATDSGWLDRPI